MRRDFPMLSALEGPGILPQMRGPSLSRQGSCGREAHPPTNGRVGLLVGFGEL